VIAILFICFNGFICGRSLELISKKNRGDRKYDGNLTVAIMAILSGAVSFAYAIMWGFVIDGPNLIGLPGLILWFICISLGKRWVIDNWRTPYLWESQAALGFVSPVTYHVIHKYLVY